MRTHDQQAGGERRPRARLVSDERGTAIVEFAIVIVPLLLIVFGILDFARALNYYNALTQLAGQGARAAAVDRNPDGTSVGSSTNPVCPAQATNPTTIQCQLAEIYPATAELKNGITVCIPSVPAVGSPVTVKTTYTYNFLPFIAGKIGFGSITLTASQSERQEATPTYAAGDQTGTVCS